MRSLQFPRPGAERDAPDVTTGPGVRTVGVSRRAMGPSDNSNTCRASVDAVVAGAVAREDVHTADSVGEMARGIAINSR